MGTGFRLHSAIAKRQGSNSIMAKRPQDDLFESTTMSFGEHPEELRGCLVRALLRLLIGFVIGLAIANRVVKLIQVPPAKHTSHGSTRRFRLRVA